MEFLLIALCVLLVAGYLWYVVRIFNFLCKWFESYYTKRRAKQHSTEHLLVMWLIMASVFMAVSLVVAVFWLPLLAVSTIGEGLRDLSDLNRR